MSGPTRILRAVGHAAKALTAVGAVAVIGVAASPPASAAPQPPAPAASMLQACQQGDIILIAARGSGDLANSRYGLGETMWSAYASMYDEVANHGFNGQKLRVVAVQYDAASAWNLVYNPPAFFASLAGGINATRRLLDEYRSHRECDGLGVMLAGYSQGAMIMHRILHDPAALAGVNVWSPLLVADGDRVAYDTMNHWGGADPAKPGVGQYWPWISGSNPARFTIPDVRDVCAPQDAVCSPELGAVPWWCLTSPACVAAWQSGTLAGEIWVHTQYANSTELDRAARAIPR
ncbi:cutinase family protein [Nocardia blacklockiae]|uniref:cutinase family protein n=1 Tax=Nocardia blacklockiae TaxID=480036 RepID=UPI0018937B2E|nr:cutinase family protein [Nocardia blacklockiae]MBF6173623.1 cutinase family protein [Nocardia blacklockiae]